MARSSWKGYLKLSLVSCAVALYNATSASERVSFNTLNRKTGNRLKQHMVDSVTEEPVDPSDRVKGYQVSKGQYVIVEDEDLEALKIESTKLIEIEAFVPEAEVDQIYLDSPYYLAPDDRVAEEAFAVIRDAMAAKEVVGIGRVVLQRRERMLMLAPRGKGILATTLRYPYEVRQDAEYFSDISDIKLPEDMMGIAEVIIERKSGHFEPDKFTDRYEEAVVSMLRAKQAGQAFVVHEAPAPSKVVNIMDALKRSLEAEGGGSAEVRRPRAPSKKPAEVEKKPAAAEKKAAAAAEIRKPKARKRA
jgi:DNA end-binding protein Ku